MTYDPSADPVHGSGWNSAARWGGWEWRAPSHGQHFRTCSFCGSIRPEDLAAETAGTGCGYPDCPDPRDELANIHFPIAGQDGDPPGSHRFVNTGWRASWADRKYGWPHKFYVEGLVNRSPERKRVISAQTEDHYQASLRGEWPGLMNLEWHRAGDVPGGYITDGWRDGHYQWFGFGADATHHAKFYTIHLADPRLPAGVKDTIERVAGLRFTFTDDGRVGWEGCPAA